LKVRITTTLASSRKDQEYGAGGDGLRNLFRPIFYYGSYLNEKRQPTSPGGRARGKIISLLGPGFKV
jgi:hypothetical protein